VDKDGAAAKAGIKPGDVLLGVNGKTVERSSELPPLVAAVKPRTQATFEVWRASARAGILAVVTAVNGKPVKSVEDLRAAAEKAKGTVALLVRRGESSLFVPVEVG
jgi:serine protease Do